MHAQEIFNNGHQWIMFGRDPDKPDRIIDTNQYMVVANGKAILLDPGGIELFAPMLAGALKFVQIEQITDVFASHQDPDIISSLGLWDQVLSHARLHCSWIWEGFIRHFGMQHIEYCPIGDEGGVVHLGNVELRFIPAHYMHSSGNFHVYDARAKILFSGDVGAALEAVGAPLEVDDFDAHIPKMIAFHQRWMPSNRAKNDWVKRVRELDIDLMVPQHGRMFRGAAVKRFLDWFEQLDVGSAVNRR